MISLPYGNEDLKLDISPYKQVTVLESKPYICETSETEEIQRALENPIGSKKLSELCKDKKNVLLITNDMTRPMPSKITIPALIAEIKRINKDIGVSILIASGLHREMNRQELIDKMGAEIVSNYPVLVHNAYDNESLVSFGEISTGNILYLNKAVLEHDLVIAEGFIEAHWLAGFSGGRKSIFPGIAGADTIMYNHSPKNVEDQGARPGNTWNNPAHLEFIESARKAKLAFILNVVLDREKNIVKAFAGDSEKAHDEGCEFVRDMMEVVCEEADITISTNSGYPLDLNLYQSCKGMDTASYVTKENGVIIMCSYCKEGIGHGGFAQVLEMDMEPQEILNKLRSGEVKIYDQWGAQVILNLLTRFKIILVSSLRQDVVEKMNMIYASSIEQAMKIALSFSHDQPLINIIPEGPVIIAKTK